MVDLPRALSHPLPAGMRDLLPEEAQRRRILARAILEHFALYGYQLVTLPAFELAEVLERGLGALDPADVLRFVEPESGEVAALRPDMTPQIARMVATRLGQEPPPIRLCYEGTIVRRRLGRARRHRQVPQAGVERYGALPENDTLAGDLEMLGLAASVVRRLGLTQAVIDLGHATIVRALLEPLPPPLATEVCDALGQKDGVRVERLLEGYSSQAVLVRLCDLYGGGPGERTGEAVLAEAAPLLSGTRAEPAFREIQALWTAARGAPHELGTMLRLDLGEVRGFAYYTGVIFQLLAPGPGEPIGAGGRYDDLLARFQAPMPAIGFALYLDPLAQAREAAGAREGTPPSALVTVDSARDAVALITALHAHGVAAVTHAPEGALAYAAAWRYSHVIMAAGEPRRYVARSLLGAEPLIEHEDPDALAEALASCTQPAGASPGVGL